MSRPARCANRADRRKSRGCRTGSGSYRTGHFEKISWLAAETDSAGMDGGRLQERRHPQTAGSLASDSSTESARPAISQLRLIPADRVDEPITALTCAMASADRSHQDNRRY
jgi:hypothetical protein